MFENKNVQKEGFKKSKFFFNHDVSSTYEFGECQPLLCHLCATGQESHSIHMNSIVRMSPLVFPTFGRVVHKVTHHFVPFDHLWKNWKNVLSDVETTSQRVNSTDIEEFTSLPTKFPSISLDCLMQILLRKQYSSYRKVERTGNAVVNNTWSNSSNALSDANLRSAFGYTTTVPCRFVHASDMEEYIDTTDPGSPQHLTPDSSDFSVMWHGATDDFMILFKLTSKGKRLYKILTGLGYRPSFSDRTEVNLLPLLAFYKAYFDAYNVPQYQNYYTSRAYKITKHLNAVGSVQLLGDSAGSNQTVAFDSLVTSFFHDLSECWYTQNNDFVSSCLDAAGYLPSVSNSNPNGLKYPGVTDSGYGVLDASDRVNGTGHGAANMNNGLAVTTYKSSTPAVNKYFDQISDEILKLMYISVQRDSAIGNEIALRLKARGFDTYVADCKQYFLGTNSQPVQISDVMSNTDSYDSSTGSGATLGAYAGKGVGITYNDTINFTNSELGYIISISTIYPISKVVNPLNPTHLGLDKFTFYNAQFDGLSYEQVPRNNIGHLTGTDYPAGIKGSQLFGFHPRYTGYKTSAGNILNGGFSLRSEFLNWLPYTLDRVIVENYHPARNIGGTAQNPTFESEDIATGSTYLPSAGLDWRYVANAPWKGNYNRIFANGQVVAEFSGYSTWNERTPSFDNFFVNTEIEHQVFASMLPIEDSWNAIDDEKPHQVIQAKQ